MIDFLVRVNCMTYNQSAFITDALDGFVMQRTSFPFVCTIVDDASADGEQEVIRKYVNERFDLADSCGCYDMDTDYGHVTFARHKTNLNCYFAIVYLRENHYGRKRSKAPYLREWKDTRYIAICEGDDYWTDPLKLQKQVDFLDRHKEYSMCFHKVEVLECDGDDSQWAFSDLQEKDYSAREIYDEWLVPTCSVMYRKGKPFESNPVIVFGDIFMFLQLAERGKLRCLGFTGGVYRRHRGGISFKVDEKRAMAIAKQYRWMARRFPQKELRSISVRKENDFLIGVLYNKDLKGVWKCRLRYAWLHPHLLCSRFMLQTFSYIK